MPLYPQQKVVADKLLNLYKHPNYYRQQRLYLSGEMGVGKTYIASAVIAKLMKDRPVFLIVPPQIVTKWNRVLHSYAGKYKTKIFNTKTCLNNPHLLMDKNCVNLIPNRNFNRLFTYDPKDVQHLKFEHKMCQIAGKPDSKQIKRHTIGIQNYQQTIHNNAAPLIVYDEIHQASHSKLRCFNVLMSNTKAYGLFLTGTIFNMSLDSVSRLIKATHPRLYKRAGDRGTDFEWFDIHIAPFMKKVWQYISLSISLKQVKNTTSPNIQKIHQTVLPIKSVKIDDEELAFYKLAYIQLKALGKKPAVAKLGASNFLDYPQRPPEIQIKNAAGVHRLRRDTLDAVAMPLTDMNLGHTKKYQALRKYLDKYGAGKRTLIYATDHSLIKTLTHQLCKDGYKAKHLKSTLKPDQYSTYINNCYSQGTRVFVVDPHDVNVGVDIDGDVLIWYQLLLNMSDIIQAQRRIHRLSSTRNSLIIFIPYRLTYQEELVNHISNAGKDNAASYGVQDRSNLAKFTGILLNVLDD